MDLMKQKYIKELRKYLHDPLYKNSLFIILSSISKSGFGFIFWLIAAKLYSTEDVGIATVLISLMALLILFSRFGMDFSIIRFFPLRDKSRVFSTSMLITTLFSIIFAIIFIVGVDTFSPQLAFLKLPLYASLFIVFIAASSMISLTGISFIAIRQAHLDFLQNLCMGSRIIFLIPFIAYGAIGIVSAVGISFLLALFFAFLFLPRYGINSYFSIDKAFLRESFHFSAGNYIVGFLVTSPNMLMPILVLNLLGAEEAAYYYIAFAISSLLFMIPNAISISLFVEGSHGEALKKTIIKSLFMTFLILTPLITLLYFGGEWMLEMIGKDYAENGFELLRIMILTSFFATVVSIYLSIKRIQKDIKGLLFLSGLVFILLISLAYFFMIWFGLIGIGYAWMVSYGIGSLIILGLVWKEGWI